MSSEKADVFSLGITILKMTLLLTEFDLLLLNDHLKKIALKKKNQIFKKFK